MSKISKYLTATYAKNKKYFNKRNGQGVALALSMMLLFTGAYVNAPKNEVSTTNVDIQPASTAGVISAVSTMELTAGDSSLVYASADVTVVAATTDQVEPDVNDEYDEWADKVMADVEEYLYIRAEASSDSEAIAKLRAGDVATLVDVFDGWYEIESGNAHGFVSADFCVTGIEAYELAMDVCDTYATTDVAGLRIRSEASGDAKILKVVPKGEKLVVNSDAEVVDGWVAVTAGSTSGYVKADYVQVDMETGEAVTLAEEAEAKAAAEEAARQAKEAAAAAAAANQAIIDSADDVTLLAAIIQIEAGNEAYEGQVAVGSVVMNRVRSGGYPSTVGGVIFARGQFATSRMSSVISKGPKASCIQAASEALAGVDPTGGATHFRRAGSKEGLIIGNHVFY
ncbi:MAG: cell wall hydrolase [Pseudobutyrivibrio sp.]|nr:cell wall hydrolase [Pseudobutyrivibrio sp.]